MWDSIGKFLGEKAQFVITIIVAIFMLGWFGRNWEREIVKSGDLARLVTRRLDTVEQRITNLEADIRANRNQDLVNSILLCREDILIDTVVCQKILEEINVGPVRVPRSSSPQ